MGASTEALARALDADRAAGFRPACVVATVGTTSSTAVDPLRPIAELCRRHGAWLHVDAAYAGAAAIVPELRAPFDGVEGADSLVFNPHKWLLTNFDCTAYFVRDPSALLATFQATPEYLRTAHDAEVVNYRDWGIQLGRRFRALKLWFVIRSYGVEGLRALIRRARRAGARVRGLGGGRSGLRGHGAGPIRAGVLPVAAGGADGGWSSTRSTRGSWPR